MKRLFAILAVLVPVAVFGQGVVTGVVCDSKNGAKLEYVNVGVPGTTIGTATLSDGSFSLSLSSNDSVTIRFSFTGYETAERRVVAGMKVSVELKPVTHLLQQVEISDDRSRETSFTHIEVAKLDDAVGPTAGVEGLLKMLPDVQSNNELSSQYSVRGGSFDENLVYINGVEVFRPMLIRSAQQEGMSIINPDMVSYILFSPGGFDASYGDRLSSALDITYGLPTEFVGKVSASLLGASAIFGGKVGERLSYVVGLRHHDNSYIFGSLDTKGSYTTSYSDLQALVGYNVNNKLSLDAMAIWTRNVYGLVPESQTTTFGGFFLPLVLRIYFDGQEKDLYNTILGSVGADYRPNEDWHFRTSLSFQRIQESERYDVQDQYWLYELGMGQSAGDTVMFDRGVGTFLEHARNRLTSSILSLDMRATRHALLGSWQLGAKVQYEGVEDHLREWRLVDSAGFAMPTFSAMGGDSSSSPSVPILQQYANANNGLNTFRTTLFVQREAAFTNHCGDEWRLIAGVRGLLYFNELSDVSFMNIVSPRASVSYKPHGEQDILFRLAAGVYRQPPFYREYRGDDGQLAHGVGVQTSYQTTATTDWRFKIWDKPFALTADLYYKYITDLVPYTIDNLRLRYRPDLTARAYATGFSVRVNGEIVKGLESWASISLMQTQEDIEGDGHGWLPRPTDQRFSFKLFFQDNIPQIPWWRMSLNLVFGSGIPVSSQFLNPDSEFRLPNYYRVDWGNSVQLNQFESLKKWRLFKYVDDIQVGLEVFNLFNFRNVVSYLWVSDYENRYYPVPNYLTARQLNVKITVIF